MTATLEILRANLLSPMVLAFALGVVATMARSDLKFPDQIYAALSIYLLLAIGLKGGVALSATTFAEVAGPAAAGLAIGIAIPLWCYAILTRLGRLSIADAAALAAHYGSVSAVTFIASLVYLQRLGIPHEGFLPALLALMEVPAIAVALLLARRAALGDRDMPAVVREVVAGRSVLLLAGGLAIGWLSGPRGYAQVAPFFAEPFQGVLTLFLLDMGMVAARRLRDFRQVGGFLITFALIAPVIHGCLGTALGKLSGLSMGGSMVLGVLAASASYIAAPAAVRVALPEANPSYYLTAALAITFPFNLVVGLPLYFAVAKLLFPGTVP